MQRTLKCPTCRCDIEVTPAPSIALTHALHQLFPREVTERAREDAGLEEPEQLEGMRSLPLFVLEPLLPGQKIHLHIFEPRYIRLTQRALSESALEKCFGMVAVSQRGISQFGVTAKIVDWSEAPGGRYFLTCVGERRFRILRTWDVDGYRNAEVAWARDVPPEPQASPAATTSAAVAAGAATPDGSGAREQRDRTEHAAAEERAALPGLIMARECKAVISEWTTAVGQGWERRTGQLEALLRDLGPAPEASQPERLGFWCAALINPLPALGVAPEIRLQALECTDSVERLRLVLVAADSSLQHMRAPRFRLGRFLGVHSHEAPWAASVLVLLAAMGVSCGLAPWQEGGLGVSWLTWPTLPGAAPNWSVVRSFGGWLM